MKTRSKSILLLVFVLIIGFILGALVSGSLQHMRENRIIHMSPEEKFNEIMEKIIQPTEKQKTAIKQILKRESVRIASIQQQKSQEFIAAMDTSKKAMDSLLTTKQKQKLEQHMLKMKSHFAEREVERLDQLLDLNNTQIEKIKEILLSGFGSHNFKPGNFIIIESEIEKVLSPEQREKFQNFRSHLPRPFNSPMER